MHALLQIVRHLLTRKNRHFIPDLIVKCSSVLFFAYTAPLLEEKRSLCFNAYIPYCSDPLFFHEPCSGAGFTANNHPGKLLECKERVMRDKAYTYLKNSIDKVRVCRKYVCGSNPERLKGYFSEFIRSKNRQRRNAKQPEVTTPDATAK